AYASSPDVRFPYVLTTYRLTEHHTSGAMSRTLSHLAELQPELFAELSPELASEVLVENGDWIEVSTARDDPRPRSRDLAHAVTRRAGAPRSPGRHAVSLGPARPRHRRRRQRSRGDVGRAERADH